MSYLMIVIGEEPDISAIANIELRREPDQEPTWAIVLKPDDTIHHIINEAQDLILLGKPFEATRLSYVLDACFNVHSEIRIWWDTGHLDDWKNVTQFNDKGKFIKEISSCIKKGKDICVSYVPNK